LILAVKYRRYFVQFAAQGSHGLRAEVSSNSVLPADHRLDTASVARLTELGWKPPTGTLENSTPERDPDGSPNFFMELPVPVDFSDLAARTIDTLVEVLGVPYPGALWYQAFDGEGSALVFPTLQLTNEPREAPTPVKESAETAHQKLLQAVRHLLDSDEVDLDSDGGITVRLGSAEIHARVLSDPLRIRIWSPVLTALPDSTAILRAVNELNARLPFGRLLFIGETVIAAEDVRADSFDFDQVIGAISHLGELAESIGREMQARFGGRNAAGLHLPAPDHPSSAGYL
jgi:hypothetical protein